MYKLAVYSFYNIAIHIRHDSQNMELKTKYVDWYLMKLNVFVLFELQGVHDEFKSKGVERSMILWDDIDKAEFNELIYYTYNRCEYENCLDSYTNYYYEENIVKE